MQLPSAQYSRSQTTDVVRRVALANGCGPSDNLGDWALTVAAAALVWNAWPEAEIVLVPWARQADLRSTEEALREALGACGRSRRPLAMDQLISTHPSAPPFSSASAWQRARILAWNLEHTALGEIRLQMSRFCGSTRPWTNRSSPADAIAASDVVVLVGGNIVCAPRDVRRLAHLYRALAPVRLAQALNIPTLIIGASYDVCDSRITRWLALNPFRNASRILTREPLTERRLSEVGLKNTSLVGDTAFCLTYEPKTARETSLIAVNALGLREWDADIGTGPRQYAKALAFQIDVLRQILNRFPGVRLLLISHETSESVLQSDVDSLRSIAAALGETDRVLLAEPNGGLGDIFQHYGACALGIGPRYHGCVFGAMMGTPVIGLGATSQKLRGITSLLNVPFLPSEGGCSDAAIEGVDRLLRWGASERDSFAAGVASIGQEMLRTFVDAAHATVGTPRLGAPLKRVSSRSDDRVPRVPGPARDELAALEVGERL